MSVSAAFRLSSSSDVACRYIYVLCLLLSVGPEDSVAHLRPFPPFTSFLVVGLVSSGPATTDHRVGVILLPSLVGIRWTLESSGGYVVCDANSLPYCPQQG